MGGGSSAAWVASVQRAALLHHTRTARKFSPRSHFPTFAPCLDRPPEYQQLLEDADASGSDSDSDGGGDGDGGRAKRQKSHGEASPSGGRGAGGRQKARQQLAAVNVSARRAARAGAAAAKSWEFCVCGLHGGAHRACRRHTPPAHLIQSLWHNHMGAPRRARRCSRSTTRAAAATASPRR